MKKFIIIFLFLIIIINVSGCGKRDVEKLSITTALGIDKGETEEIKVTAQILNANAVGSKPRDVSPVYTISVEGKTIQEALRKLTTVFTSKLFYYHFQILIFGEELAKEGIEKYLNFFAINNETQHTYNVIIAKENTAEDILKIRTIGSLIPVVTLIGKIEASADAYGISKVTYMDEVITYIRRGGEGGFTLASLKVEGDVEKGSKGDNVKNIVPDAYIVTSTLAVFKEDKLVGWLNERESIGYNHIQNNIKSTFYVITKSDGSLASIEADSVKTKIKVQEVDGKPKIIIDVSVTGELVEDMSNNTLLDAEYRRDIENRTSYEIKKMLEKTIFKAKELNSDFLHFHLEIYRKELKLWKNIKDIYYDEIFPNLEVEINVETKIMRIKTGMEKQYGQD